MSGSSRLYCLISFKYFLSISLSYLFVTCSLSLSSGFVRYSSLAFPKIVWVVLEGVREGRGRKKQFLSSFFFFFFFLNFTFFSVTLKGGSPHSLRPVTMKSCSSFLLFFFFFSSCLFFIVLNVVTAINRHLRQRFFMESNFAVLFFFFFFFSSPSPREK